MTNLNRELTQIVEMDIDRCLLTYGSSPCTAVLGTSGVRKCYNTFTTCQDKPNFTPSLEPATVFAPLNEDYFLPAGRTDFDGITGGTFARSTTATYTDSRGTIQAAAIDEPRVDNHLFNGTRFQRAGMLTEEAATQLVLHNTDFTQGVWSFPTGDTVLETDSADGPRGPGTMSRITCNNNAADDYGLVQSSTASVGVQTTFTLVVRTDVHRYVGLWGFGNGGTGVGFDLQSMTSQVNGSWDDAGIISIGDDLALIWGVVTPLVSGTLFFGLFEDIGGGKANLSGAFFDFDMIQGEAGNIPGGSSFVLSGGSTAPRAADDLRIPAAVMATAIADADGSPELTDGGFSLFTSVNAKTGVSDGTVSFVDGVLTIVRNTTAAIAWPDDMPASTNTQLWTFEIVSGVASIEGTAGLTAGVYSLFRGATTEPVIWPQSTSSTIVLRNISIREVSMPSDISGSMHSLLTYADLGAAGQITLFDQRVDVNNRITVTMDTDGAKTGTFTLTMVNGGASATVSSSTEITPGNNVDARIAWSADAATIGIALNGVDVESATAIGVPDLVTADAVVFDSGGVAIIEQWLGWFVNITSAGRIEATS